jgi:hypothetical protein
MLVLDACARRSVRSTRLLQLGWAIVWSAAGLGLAAAAPVATPPDNGSGGQAGPPLVGAADRPSTAGTPKREWHRRLTGIVVTPAVHAALFASAGGTRAVREGEQIDGWTVTAIAADSVTLAAEGETKILRPEALAPDPASEAPSPRPEPRGQWARSVAAALQAQEQDQAAAETALIEATRQMSGP